MQPKHQIRSRRRTTFHPFRRIHRPGPPETRGRRRAARRSGREPQGFLGAPGADRAALAQAVHASRWTNRRAPNYRWFIDGELNVSYNCLDVHLEERGHKTAVTFVGEPGDVRHVSYRELHADVCRFANALQRAGREAGRPRGHLHAADRPRPIVAMHACARIGAIHSVVFGGFSALSLKDRIEDAGATRADHRRRRLARRQGHRAQGSRRQGAVAGLPQHPQRHRAASAPARTCP